MVNRIAAGSASTERSRMKAERRSALVDAAAVLVAERGYHGLRLEDLGAAVGISGPAVYRHFPNKEAVLVELLVGISEYLHAGGEEVLARGSAPLPTLHELVAFHLDFAMTSPRLIEIQFRDLANLPTDAQRSVRSLQRRYVEIWVRTLRELDSDCSEDDARVQAHAAFGLLNSTPQSMGRVPASLLRHRLSTMALTALGIDPASSTITSAPTSEETA
ncbi:AcrR family transcriptional regulator [Rhodococcus sp. PvP016]|uniref:AcrR family transcriptional regulator n=2 Tax=Mycobacteriales TaxID=85007 RepID=A0ABS2KXA0_9NOCA|nr:AcrR family transcriptional regulator [Rhodococcus corynebacterioides]MBP1114813.1 AcrR family transcriptional regulator [Rhodococcus sp. PvP016]